MADPITAGALILSGVGAATSAVGSIAGGNTASAGALAAGQTQSAAAIAAGNNAAQLGLLQQNADNYEAAQVQENASSEIGAAQRRMLDTQQKTRLAESSLTANAAGSGFTATSGSPEAISASIAQRGSYEAAMNLFQGVNASTGDLNRAAGLTYSGDIAAIGGEMQQQGDQYSAIAATQRAQYASTAATQSAAYSAAGTLASAGGSMFKTYGTMSRGGNPYVAYG